MANIFNSNLAGRHIIIDARFADAGAEITNSPTKMNEYLIRATDVAGMTIAVPPVALKFPVNSETYEKMDELAELGGFTADQKQQMTDRLRSRDNGGLGGSGVSAAAIWVESHCTLHSWTDRGYISLDLFSCKDYDAEKIADFTRGFMKLTSGSVLVIDRFVDQPQKITQYDF
jgi:S-adenosylmethionine decarboxylase